MALELEEKYLYNSIRSTVPSDETREPLLAWGGWRPVKHVCVYIGLWEGGMETVACKTSKETRKCSINLRRIKLRISPGDHYANEPHVLQTLITFKRPDYY